MLLRQLWANGRAHYLVTWYTPGKLACGQAIADLPTYGSRLFAQGKAYAFSDSVRHITLTRHACVHSFSVLYWFQYFVFPLTAPPHKFYEFSRSGVRRWCTSRGQNRSARVATKWRALLMDLMVLLDCFCRIRRVRPKSVVHTIYLRTFVTIICLYFLKVLQVLFIRLICAGVNSEKTKTFF